MAVSGPCTGETREKYGRDQGEQRRIMGECTAKIRLPLGIIIVKNVDHIILLIVRFNSKRFSFSAIDDLKYGGIGNNRAKVVCNKDDLIGTGLQRYFDELCSFFYGKALNQPLAVDVERNTVTIFYCIIP